MASYFDEHDCLPLGTGEQPNHHIHMVRLLLDTGFSLEWNIEFDRLFPGHERSPPTSKAFIANLETRNYHEKSSTEEKCPVCLKEFHDSELMKCLPCKHSFHPNCILPWLSKTNSCPVCRYELPTDDKDYEEYKRQKARAKQREADLEVLHDSMFG